MLVTGLAVTLAAVTDEQPDAVAVTEYVPAALTEMLGVVCPKSQTKVVFRPAMLSEAVSVAEVPAQIVTADGEMIGRGKATTVRLKAVLVTLVQAPVTTTE
jgi:hypothetical protein